jgi:peroxiredoxin
MLSLYLLTAALAAPPGGIGDVVLLPQLSRGQELVYRGRFEEEFVRPGVQSRRSCDLTTRLLVLDVQPRHADLACCTVVHPDDVPPGTPAISARLDVLRIDWQGRLSRPPGEAGPPWVAPLEGPPTLEAAVFLETPDGRVHVGRTWDLMPAGRPPVGWRVEGTETIPAGRCLKAVGVQESDNWDIGRATALAPTTAWRRREALWVSPETGSAGRVERRTELRAAGAADVTQRSLLSLEQDSSAVLPGPLFEGRRREFLQARLFAEALAGLRPPAGPEGERAWDTLQSRIAYHLDHSPRTPYREAILWIKQRALDARRGQAAPVSPAESVAAPARLAVGRPAPDFVAADLAGGEAVRLGKWQGRPVLLAFFDPTKPTAEPLLRGLQTLHARHGGRVWVAALAVSADAEAVQRLRADLHLTLPTLAGEGLCRRLEVETTPKLVVLDGNGVVRYLASGWGEAMVGTLEEELLRWVRP